MKDHIADVMCSTVDALFVWLQREDLPSELRRSLSIEQDRLVAFLVDEKVDLAARCRFYH